jgi:hypothetical protein
VSERDAPENPELRAAMAEVAADRNERTMRRLFERLMESRLLVPVRSANEKGVELAVVREPDGGATYHAFTDEGALTALLPLAAPYVTMAAPALAGTVLEEPGATLVVNPAGPDGGRLSRRDLEMVRDRLLPDAEGSLKAPPGGSLRVLELSEEPPEELVAALRAAAEPQPGVLELYLFEGDFAGSDRHPFVGVRLDPALDEEERRGALARISEAVRPQLDPGAVLDVVALPEELLEVVTEVGRPIWERHPW